MESKEEKRVYKVLYASALLLGNRGRSQTQFITSHKKLKENQFIVVEHIDCGVFIGKVVQEVSSDTYSSDCIEYQYLQNINLSKWEKALYRKERLTELQQEMETKFVEIDKRKKFEYYADVDEEFGKLYKEYISLSNENEE